MSTVFADEKVMARGRPDGDARRRVDRTRAWRLAGSAFSFIALIVVWQFVVHRGLLSRRAVAPPTAVADALWNMLGTAEFWSTLGSTVRTWVTGLLVSIAIAIPVGLVLGGSDLLYRLFRVAIDFLRTIPPIVLLPLALLVYGATQQTALLVIVFGSVWPLLLQTMYGVHQVDPVAKDVAQAYCLRRHEVVFDLVVPSAAPFIATGIRIAATMSLLLTIGTELLGGVPGIGSKIAIAQTQYATIPTMYAYVVAATALGVVLNLLMMRLERRALSWHAAHRTA
ncbi:ABC transporter permease [Kribbella qitaiheensis]|uniref:ABC transporter permease n=1 Tax=Kribbella qitaiheensis TaxID=1544730 RepID=A0A7G6X528_9ACTN|nr:ABC transporter permease [Kribbella qitaiheensis]QNE21343.1 ABC transporter permease [Kribbella qitaiheensis]